MTANMIVFSLIIQSSL